MPPKHWVEFALQVASRVCVMRILVRDAAKRPEEVYAVVSHKSTPDGGMQAYQKQQGERMAGGYGVALEHAIEKVFATAREVARQARIEGLRDLEVGIAGIGVNLERPSRWGRRCGSCRDSMACGRH
jgi:hypothetical protein